MIGHRSLQRSLLVAAIALLAACGASQAKPTTPARSEIVVEEATVVSAQPAPREGELPPLPQPLAQASNAFAHGHGLALALLAAPGPAAPSALDEASYAQWSHEVFEPWLAQRVRDVQAVSDELGAVRDGPASEHVVAAALLGLIYARVDTQLHAITPPLSVSSDAKLLRIYQHQLNESAKQWLEQAAGAFVHCVRGAARETEPAFGLWIELCQRQGVLVSDEALRARLLSDVVAAEREADRLAAEGPRPEGPEACWTQPGLAASTAVVPVASAAGAPAEPAAATFSGNAPALRGGASSVASATTAPAAPSRTAEPARSCARRPVAKLAAPAPLSPRDQRYGARDATTGVRVWAALAENPTMDAAPLIEPSTTTALAACFARSVKSEQAVTVALHASLAVDARGKTRSATLTNEPADSASPASKPLSTCIEHALRAVAFDCSASGQPTQASVLYCLRRD